MELKLLPGYVADMLQAVSHQLISFLACVQEILEGSKLLKKNRNGLGMGREGPDAQEGDNQNKCFHIVGYLIDAIQCSYACKVLLVFCALEAQQGIFFREYMKVIIVAVDLAGHFIDDAEPA